ncbi:MAG: SDR family NAD(P)-dependent oxidoreductase [Ketobacter sp.]|nr:MAG: SDR family NAD(P)-dependent oxidoreductase [Ketobacter sp.]
MAYTMLSLERYGPWALVTGASSGIGMSFARQLAAAGFNLVITARRTQRLDALAAELQQQHPITVKTVNLDLSDTASLSHLVEACHNKDIGLIISNAGFGFKQRHHKLRMSDLDNMLNVNCRAPMALSHHFLPHLLERGKGGFIITSSVEAYFGVPGSAAYSATKSFAKTLGEALYGETVGCGVDTLVLCPGLTDTEAPTLQGFDKKEMKGMKSPDDVAAAALQSLGKQPVLMSASLPFRCMIQIARLLPRGLLLRKASASIDKIIRP